MEKHSKVTSERMEEMMMNTKMLTKDLGTVLVGQEAVDEGIICKVGGIKEAYTKIHALIKNNIKKKDRQKA